MKKSYNSIEEIKQDLIIAKLNADIALEELKLFNGSVKKGYSSLDFTFTLMKWIRSRWGRK